MIRKILGYFNTLFVHKWYVFKYCCLLGITWRGIVHDLSMLSPEEFFELVKNWDGVHSSISNSKRRSRGYSRAWISHKRNLHHPEAWIDISKDGMILSRLMPWKYMMELIADFISTGIMYAKIKEKEFTFEGEYEWWIKNKNRFYINNITVEFITKIFNDLRYYENKGKSYVYLYLINLKKSGYKKCYQELYYWINK